MTKPRLGKVRALFYVLQHSTKEAAPILTQPLYFIYSQTSYAGEQIDLKSQL